MEAPKYESPPPDPTVTALSERAKADDIAATQRTAQFDTATLMARYGTQLALSGSPTSAGSLAVAPARAA
jgi:hypothetical protein